MPLYKPNKSRVPNHHRTGILSEDYPADPYRRDLDKAFDPHDAYWRTGNPSRTRNAADFGLPREFALYSAGNTGHYLLVCTVPRLYIGQFSPDAHYYDAIDLGPNSHVGDRSRIFSYPASSFPFNADGSQKSGAVRKGWFKRRKISALSPQQREVADLFVACILDEMAVSRDRRANDAADAFRRAMGAAPSPYLDSTDAAFDALYNTRDRNPRGVSAVPKEFILLKLNERSRAVTPYGYLLICLFPVTEDNNSYAAWNEYAYLAFDPSTGFRQTGNIDTHWLRGHWRDGYERIGKSIGLSALPKGARAEAEAFIREHSARMAEWENTPPRERLAFEGDFVGPYDFVRGGRKGR